MRQDKAIRILTRRPAKAMQLFGPSVEIISGSLLEEKVVKEASSGMESIYHLAGLYRFGFSQRESLNAINVQGTHHLLQAAWKARINKVVLLSSAGVLKAKRWPLTEKDFPTHDTLGCFYKNSKRRAELEALNWAQQGLPVVIASPTCPLGAEDELPTPTGRMVLDYLLNRFPFGAHTGLNFLGVADLAQGILAAGEHGRGGERYILGGEDYWLDEFFRLLSAITQIPAPQVMLPWPLIFLAGLAGEAAQICGSKDGARLCLETAWQARRVQFFSSQKAADDLGWQARTPISLSLRQAISWFQNEVISPTQPAPLGKTQSHVA